MSTDSESVVTGEMLGAMVAFGVDTVFLVAILAVTGHVAPAVAGAVSAGVVAVFAAWMAVRWWRLGDGGDETDPVEALKRRYANGEVSEAEFERRLDALMDADRRVEDDGTSDERTVERSR